MEDCVRNIRDWMHHNCLKLIEGKTKFMIIQPRSSRSWKLKEEIPLHIGDQRIPPVQKARNTGVTFDNTLSMDRLINDVCWASYYHLRNIGLIKKKLTSDSKTVAHAMVISRLDMNNTLYCGLPGYILDKLQWVQNSAARLLSGCSRRADITPVLKELHWLPVRQRITFKLCTMVFKALTGCAPKYIADMLNPYIPTRTLRSSASNLLVTPPARTVSYGEGRFAYVALATWNSLPQKLRHTSLTLAKFKSLLKTHLFCSAFKNNQLTIIFVTFNYSVYNYSL